MKTIYSDNHRLQDGKAELNDGLLVPCFEMPRRADLVLARVREVALGEVLEPTSHGLDPVLRVHTEPFVSFLRDAWREWVAAHGEYDALPLTWPTRTLRHDRVPTVIDGRLSYYSLDAGTPITAGTWTASTSAVDVALTGADVLLAGERVAFSLCRPPGHHANPDVYGGYCFLNNAAVATQYLLDYGSSKVGVLDVDYHHGNGTQAIFYDRADVPFVSLHGDPRQEYPYFLGYDDELGSGAGEGANRNYPLPWARPGTPTNPPCSPESKTYARIALTALSCRSESTPSKKIRSADSSSNTPTTCRWVPTSHPSTCRPSSSSKAATR